MISLHGLTGTVVTPAEPDYYDVRLMWNRAINKFPGAIVFCETERDVSNAVIWARRHRVPFRIRNGRHNYAGFSTGNGLLVIDLSRMTGVDMGNGYVAAQGGVNNSIVYNTVSPLGYPFAGGTCPTVGVAGYAMGGGWGLSCRHLGLGCDNLAALELINADGRLVTASCKQNPALYWALRGAGDGNFGVAVKTVFRLPPKVESVTLVQLYYPNTDAAAQTLFISTWQDWLSTADSRVTLQASVYHSEEEGYAVYSRGLFYGTSEEAENAVAQLTNLPGCEASFEQMTFYDAIRQIEASYPGSEKFKSTGRFVVRPLEQQEIERLVDLMRDYPEGSTFAALSLYALGGRVAEVSPRATAFFYRNARYILLVQSVWTQDEFANLNSLWVDSRFDYLKTVTTGSFVNFPYSGLKDYEHAYWGGNVPQLRRVKRLYDPCNVFKFPQSIRI